MDKEKLKAIIMAEYWKRSQEEVTITYHPLNDTVLWKRVFITVFGREPLSTHDPDWDVLLHREHLGGLDVLSKYLNTRTDQEMKKAV